MEPLMLTQLGLGAAQAIGGGITAFGQKGTSLKPLDENIAQKQENLRRKKEAENRARAQARQGFNPQDLTQMNRGATDAMGVGQANLAGLTAGQRMGASAANLGNYQQNVNKIAGANTNKMQENERYLDSTINGVNQAANQVSDAGLDKFQIEAERAAALRKAGEGFLGAGLTNLTGGAQQWQNRRDWAKLKADRDASMKGIYGGGITNGSEAMGGAGRTDDVGAWTKLLPAAGAAFGMSGSQPFGDVKRSGDYSYMPGAGGTVTQQSLPLGAQPQPYNNNATLDVQSGFSKLSPDHKIAFQNYIQSNGIQPDKMTAQDWQNFTTTLQPATNTQLGGYQNPSFFPQGGQGIGGFPQPNLSQYPQSYNQADMNYQQPQVPYTDPNSLYDNYTQPRGRYFK